MANAIEAIAIVVPARDEEILLPECLRAITAACAEITALGIAVGTVVVANQCTDTTARIAGQMGAQVLVTSATTVGQARSEGCEQARLMFSHVPEDRLWIANTDADSAVPRHWLREHCALAYGGWDVIAGTIALDPLGQRAFGTWVECYERGISFGSGHRHAHGANLGVRAGAYRRADGFAAVPNGEDRMLLESLSASGAAIAWSTAAPVQTSARHDARAPGGVSADLWRHARLREQMS